MMTDEKKEEFIKKLEEWGEDEVKTKLDNKTIANPEKVGIAKRWLENNQKESKKERQKFEDKRKNREIQSAEKAANAAEKSAKWAIVSALAALMSVAISLIALYSSCNAKSDKEQVEKVEQKASSIPPPSDGRGQGEGEFINHPHLTSSPFKGEGVETVTE